MPSHKPSPPSLALPCPLPIKSPTGCSTVSRLPFVGRLRVGVQPRGYWKLQLLSMQNPGVFFLSSSALWCSAATPSPSVWCPGGGEEEAGQGAGREGPHSACQFFPGKFRLPISSLAGQEFSELWAVFPQSQNHGYPGEGTRGWVLWFQMQNFPVFFIYFKFCDWLVNSPFPRVAPGLKKRMGSVLRLIPVLERTGVGSGEGRERASVIHHGGKRGEEHDLWEKKGEKEEPTHTRCKRGCEDVGKTQVMWEMARQPKLG